ncbi:MAG: FISUMP domain-containing protein, partial [Bacteroidales bacterium]|nr:FISUMP domain-containing protein [Bacteroidales bacterium]
TDYLGGESVAGGKLKEIGTTHWNTPNTGATNETGFTALPGGYRYGNGAFDDIGYGGYWWSATELSTSSAWNRSMNCNDSDVGRSNYGKEVGFSVRCVRD